ncbi:PHP domain-containing protein [Falsarthrobacter nasiphocae]|uniref:Metal-dependent phosphoesterase TrpH n=1 Tax=Falsarthrobacter nasiphocae TaxID=189863 RepID=A0AAE3YFZ3_9MICC|nr:PHP domain-containing protein [Falsarthrobacter nasiphocae]MDR6891470.1 putative metal-dependent phosphoesterase TrpH [Falsarthrobacter nasiphocae]
MTIDLHTHSAFSDGTQWPEELLEEAAGAGVTTLALTDHDTFAGWGRAMAAGERVGVRVIRGVEVSCRSAEGISVHMLGYLPDPENAALAGILGGSRAARDTRARRMVELIGEDYPLTWADVEAVAGEGATIGRPHIADALIARGLVASREQAFAGILAGGSPYFLPHPAPEPCEAIRAIRAAGGVPVFAHPRARLRGRVLPDSALGPMVDAGLAGLEADHRDNPPHEREQLRRIAEDLGLLVTGSSDFHGRGKPNVLGENTTAPEVLEAILAQATSGLT